MVRRYTLEQEEFVRKRLDAQYPNAVIRDEYQARFPESHAENPFELNQVSYLRKKNKEGSLGFRNPGFRQLVASINEKRAANGQPPLGDPVEPEEDEEEDDEEDEEASDDADGSPQASQNVTASNAARQAIVATAAFRPALAPTQSSTPHPGTQAPVQAQTQARFDPRAASNPNAASVSLLAVPSAGSVANPLLAAQTSTFHPSAQQSQQPNDVIETSRVVTSSSASKGETSATDDPSTARPTQEPERTITGTPTRKNDDMARGVPGPNMPQKEQRNLPASTGSDSALRAFQQAHEPTRLPQFAVGDFHPGMRNTSAAGNRPQGTVNPRQLTKSPGAAAAGTPGPVFWAAAPGTQLAPNATHRLDHTEASPLLSQTDADGTLGKRKNTSPTPKPAATSENGEKRPKLSQNQPDTPSHPADAAEPDELGRMSLPFVLGAGRWPSSGAHGGNQRDQPLPDMQGSHNGFVNISKAPFPTKQSGGNEDTASQLKKLRLHVGKDGSATVQSPSPASTGSHPPLQKPAASAHIGSLQPAASIQPTRQPAGHTGHHGMLPIPSVRDFKRSAGKLPINSGFPPIIGQQQTHQGSGQTADAGLASSGGKAEAARQEADALLDMIEGQDLIEAAIQAGKDAQNMIVSNRDPNHPGNYTQSPAAAAIRVTSTPQGPVVEQAPQPSEEDAEVYYVTTPIPGTDVRPCPVGADCPVPASVFHFHCHVNKTVIFSDTDDFKRAAMGYVRAQQERLSREEQ